RRHTRFSRDWSSDVCSSDLHSGQVATRRIGSALNSFQLGQAKHRLLPNVTVASALCFLVPAPGFLEICLCQREAGTLQLNLTLSATFLSVLARDSCRMAGSFVKPGHPGGEFGGYPLDNACVDRCTGENKRY